MDLVREYGYPLLITVICDMLGVPHDRRDHLLDGSAHIPDLVAEKRRHPQNDLPSQLVRMEVVPPDARSAPRRAARQHTVAGGCDLARADHPPGRLLTATATVVRLPLLDLVTYGAQPPLHGGESLAEAGHPVVFGLHETHVGGQRGAHALQR